VRKVASADGRRTFKRRPGNVFDPHAGHAIAFEFKKFGSFVGDIDEPVTVVRPRSLTRTISDLPLPMLVTRA